MIAVRVYINNGCLHLRVEVTENCAEIILDKTLQTGAEKKRKMEKDADKITPWVVFLLFFLDGTMDLVGTVQLQNTL